MSVMAPGSDMEEFISGHSFHSLNFFSTLLEGGGRGYFKLMFAVFYFKLNNGKLF